MERGIKTQRSSDELLSPQNKRFCSEFIVDLEEQSRIVGKYSTSIFTLPRFVVEDILAGHSVPALRNKYRGDALDRLNYWMTKFEFWQALSYRDIQAPLQQGLEALRILLADRSAAELGGPETHSYLFHLSQDILPRILLAHSGRVERRDFDEAAYEGFFRLGATDLIQLVVDTMSSAVCAGVHMHYNRPGTINLESAGHVTFRIDPKDARVWQVIEDGQISIETRVATTDDYRIAAADFRTRWTEAMMRRLLKHGPSCALKVLMPNCKSFRLMYHDRGFGEPVLGFVAGVKTAFLPIPIYGRTPGLPITDSVRDDFTEHVEQNFLNILRHLPPSTREAWDVTQ